MHVIFISACEKKALKKTRSVLDSYAIRTGQSSWQAPMTMEGLNEVRKALKQKGITRQTAVAAYVNFGMRRMKLAWVVGAKHRFNSEGAYPVASTKRPYQRRQVEPWVRASSLLAGAAGDMHDIGKASVHFQQKLSPPQANKIIRDDVRHEWLSIKLLQQLRSNGWDWQGAWDWQQKNPYQLKDLTLGDRNITAAEDVDGVKNSLEAVDFLIVTHHGLLGADNGDSYLSLPNYSKHVRKGNPAPEQLTCAGDLPKTIFDSHQKRLNRLEKLLPDFREESEALLYWKALSLHARAALIHADHTISAQVYPKQNQGAIALFANTTVEQFKKRQNQPLEWHLRQVGDRASYISCQMMTNLNLAGLCEQTVEFIAQATQNRQFKWQNIAANSLQKHRLRYADSPALIFNIAGTGSGKTRMNLRAACLLRPDDPRISIALNLRSLTLQTGFALEQSMNLSDDELGVIIGDNITQDLFNQSQAQMIDEDENPLEPIFDAKGEDYGLPEWLSPLYDKSHHRERTILTSPLLVSTIDFLIAAGEPQRQGHHVKALLRLISSDLVLDEIDSYEPKALMAVLRLVQLAAMYGRHVICSSATLSQTLAVSVQRAFESGIAMRRALLNTHDPSTTAATFTIGIIDNEVAPKIWQSSLDTPLDNVQNSLSKGKKFKSPKPIAKSFITEYQNHLKELQEALRDKPTFRLAALIPIAEPSVANWRQAVLNGAQTLHENHAWDWSSKHKRLSFGLIRVANISHAIGLARYLAEQLPQAYIACYHGNDWRISRFHKEQRLDHLLRRHKDGKKRKTGNEHIFEDTEIQQLMKSSLSDSVPFIVVATPVEEVGRDHDFDWAIIDVSSAQSIVQTAGRINRHRLDQIRQPNIMIPQYNFRHCQNVEQKRRQNLAFIFPGYEGYSPIKNTDEQVSAYQSHDLATLLPWQSLDASDGVLQLSIDSRLRFDTKHCQLAQFDESQIKTFCRCYFYPNSDGDSDIDEVFSSSQVDSCLMTDQLYQKFTALREGQYQAIYRFKLEDNETIFEKQVAVDGAKRGKNKAWQNYSSDFETTAATSNAWLHLSPDQMLILAESLSDQQDRIDALCEITLGLYSKDSELHWDYDEGFGVMRK